MRIGVYVLKSATGDSYYFSEFLGWGRTLQTHLKQPMPREFCTESVTRRRRSQTESQKSQDLLGGCYARSAPPAPSTRVSASSPKKSIWPLALKLILPPSADFGRIIDRRNQRLRVCGEVCAAIFADPAARLANRVLAPFQISCTPAKIAIAATTALSLRAGTTRAKAHPRSTPGTPPARSCTSTGVLITPNLQWNAPPITARTSPNTRSVPTTCGGVSSEQFNNRALPKLHRPAQGNPAPAPHGRAEPRRQPELCSRRNALRRQVRKE